MPYFSTRGGERGISFEEVTLQGLARDGGLYLPEAVPNFAPRLADMRVMPYTQLAREIMLPFMDGALTPQTLDALLAETYGDQFRAADVTPLVKLNERDYVLELFHGPTLAFKDLALQFLGRLFDQFMKKHDRHMVVLGATSGDTGSAAIEACRGRNRLSVVMLHPDGRVSDVQRRQMTTVADENVLNIAIDGTFDDCQRLVKACFSDHVFAGEVGLTAVNSINWARVLAQTVYYAWASLQLGVQENGLVSKVHFSVPTGNFGDILAGYYARNMGFPVGQLVIAVNENDILYRTRETGQYALRSVVATSSPSMDIQISSNFERYLRLMTGSDGRIKDMMTALADGGLLSLTPDEQHHMKADFLAGRVSNAAAKATIQDVWQAYSYAMDPHTAVGYAALLQNDKALPGLRVTLATAHPAKFADAMHSALGAESEALTRLPEHMKSLMEQAEHYERMPNNVQALKERVRGHLS